MQGDFPRVEEAFGIGFFLSKNKEGESLFLYLIVSTKVVSSILVRKEVFLCEQDPFVRKNSLD